MKIKRGFTLLEMLVVIGIIAILVTIGFASYSTVQKKARDAKRQSDLKSAQQIMEQCYSVSNFAYPIISGSPGTITATCAIPNNNITFTLTDPLDIDTYIYTASVTTTAAYTIVADLETSTTFTVSNQQ